MQGELRGFAHGTDEKTDADDSDQHPLGSRKIKLAQLSTFAEHLGIVERTGERRNQADPQKAPEGSVLCCMLPDTGERYLSTPLFDGVATEMTPEEVALSKSTPGFQMASAP